MVNCCSIIDGLWRTIKFSSSLTFNTRGSPLAPVLTVSLNVFVVWIDIERRVAWIL